MPARHPGVCMAESGESGVSGVDETARLEAALARIARARRPPAATGDGALAARLDALIAELRSVLGRDPGD